MSFFSEFRQPYIEEENPLEDDEAELELQLALQRSRKAKLKTIGDNNRVGPEKVNALPFVMENSD